MLATRQCANRLKQTDGIDVLLVCLGWCLRERVQIVRVIKEAASRQDDQNPGIARHFAPSRSSEPDCFVMKGKLGGVG